MNSNVGEKILEKLVGIEVKTVFDICFKTN